MHFFRLFVGRHLCLTQAAFKKGFEFDPVGAENLLGAVLMILFVSRLGIDPA